MKAMCLDSLIEEAEKEKARELAQEENKLEHLDSLAKAAKAFLDHEQKIYRAPKTNKEPKPWIPGTNPLSGTNLWIKYTPQVMNPPQIPTTDFKLTYSISGKDFNVKVF